MYPVIEPELLKEVWDLAEKDAPNEAVGLLKGNVSVVDHAIVKYDKMVVLTNISNDPQRYFALDHDQFMRAIASRITGSLLCLWHSHTDSLPNLSEEDCEVMWAIKLPMLVVSLKYRCAIAYTFLKPNPDGKRPIVEWGKWSKP